MVLREIGDAHPHSHSYLQRFEHRSLCKAAAVIAMLEMVTRLLRRLSCFRGSMIVRAILRGFADHVGHGLSYAVCFVSIYGLSFSEGADSLTTWVGGRGVFFPHTYGTTCLSYHVVVDVDVA